MSFIKNKLVIIILLMWMVPLYHVHSATNPPKTISLDLQHIALHDALQILAKFINLNIVISPTVRGIISLHLENISPNEAFNALLRDTASKWRINDVWFIGPDAEIIQSKQEKVKFEVMLAESLPLVTRFWQIHYAKAEDILRLIQESKDSLLSKRGVIRIDKRTNILYIHDTEKQIQEINRLILRIDIPVKQVLIEAKLASIDRDYERELGIHLSLQKNPSKGFTIATIADGTQLNLRLNALENTGHGEIISSPVCLQQINKRHPLNRGGNSLSRNKS